MTGLRGCGRIGIQVDVLCASSGADVDTSNAITSPARNNEPILDPMQSSGTRQPTPSRMLAYPRAEGYLQDLGKKLPLPESGGAVPPPNGPTPPAG